MRNTETSKYNVPQQDLYTIGRIGWKNYDGNLSSFAAFSPRYTKEYGLTALSEIAAAEAMPTNNASVGISVDNRIMLTRSADNGLALWQNMKRYILEAYDADRSVGMLNAAGQSYYSDAYNYSWKSLLSLMNAGSAFIKSHLAELLANDNMPPTFGDDFDAAKNDFNRVQSQFLGSMTDGNSTGLNRIKANNAINTKLVKMLQDGQQIFLKDEGIKQQFVFSNLKSIVSGVAQAGLRGFVTDAVTALPITAATVATANNVYMATTDASGRFDLTGLAAGDYPITITAANYADLTMTVSIKTGTISTQNISLSVVVAATGDTLK